jgi:cytochrome oxidase assembly protein ShyY1
VKPYQRIIALTLALIVVLPISFLAANWQLSRHQEREERNQLILDARVAEPRDIQEFKGESPSEYTPVRISGVANDEDGLWRRQILNGMPGFTVLQNFLLEDGSTVTVALGWSQTPEIATDLLTLEQPFVAYVRYPSARGTSPTDVPSGQFNYVSELMSDDFLFYAQLKNAPHNLTTIGLPEVEAGPHLGYVGQWILIGIAFFVLYVLALRRIRENHAKEIKS